MRRSWLWLPSLFAFACVLTPTFAHAQLNTIIQTTGQCVCPGSAPDFGCVLSVFQIVIGDFVAFVTIFLTILIAWAGFTYILNPTNPEKRSQANKRFFNAIIGLLIVLVAWLLVDTVMKVIYNDTTSNGSTQFGPWNSILQSNGNDYCIKQHDNPGVLQNIGTIVTQATNPTNPVGGSGGITTAPASSGNGICQVETSGPCTPANLSAFGAQASTFSQICFNESAGGAVLQSTVDKTTDGQPISFGLFQINLSANQVGGLNCPSAFSSVYTSKNHNVQITNPSLYNQCKAAALDPNTNIATAAALYNAHGLSDWKADTNRCGISMADPRAFALLYIVPLLQHFYE